MESFLQAHSSGIQLEDFSEQRPRLNGDIAFSRSASPQSAPHPYYSTLPSALSEKFHDLDSSATYARCESAVLGLATSNFIVDFGGAPKQGGGAWCAVDIGHSDNMVEAVKELLKKPRPGTLRTRWINIFSPHTQKPLVNAIAAHYGLSTRHTSALTAEPPLAPEPESESRPANLSRMDRVRDNLRRHRDVENGAYGETFGDGGTTVPMMKENERLKRGKGGYMDLVSQVWHWHAVEWGGRFMCIGFNSLHQTLPEPESGEVKDGNESYEDEWSGDEDGEKAMDKGENYPQGIRLWSWLILCDDGTVLMFHEPVGRVTSDQLKSIRRNMMTVFRSLSRSELAIDGVRKSMELGAGLEEMPFRRLISEDSRSENVESGPSLLFYYLFDDWYSSLELVVGRGAPYSHHMTNLRKEMQRNPKLSHISRLHRLARQLATLKRMYEIKKIIIDNVLYRQENSLSKPNAPPDNMDSSVPTSSQSPIHLPTPNRTWTSEPLGPMGDPNILGVPLSPLAVAKFERLRDRVKLYALGEIDDCLAEKSELLSMTFNLIAMKEAQAVERLTRVAIFLTKFTFLFLPLTLITGYFSMQLNDTNGKYSQKDFWGASGVFVAIMILILYTVGRSTETLETGIMWNSIKDVWFGCWDRKGKNGRRRVKNGNAKGKWGGRA